MSGKKALLRPPTFEDFAEFTRASESSRKFHRGLVSPPVDRTGFDELLNRNETPENEFFLVCRAEDDAIAGAINLSQIFRSSFQNAYLGYYLFENFTGNGLMTEAVALILRRSFKTLKLHRVEANVQPENSASIKVLEKNNFAKEGFSPKYLKIGGRWRDHERWAIIVENWRNRK